MIQVNQSLSTMGDLSSLVRTTMFYLASAVLVENHVIKENCDAVSINVTDNNNYHVEWNCPPLLTVSGHCKLIFKDPGDRYQICAKTKQPNVTDKFYELEINEGYSSSPYRVFTNSSGTYSMQHCVHNQDMVIKMKWDNICTNHEDEALLITTETIVHDKENGNIVNEGVSKSTKLVLGIFVATIPLAFIIPVIIHGICARCRRVNQPAEDQVQ